MSEQFDAAKQRVSELTEDPGNEVKLQLYGLYKQATEGDNETKKLFAQGKAAGMTQTWGDVHHPALSVTKGMYDGQFLFANGLLRSLVAVELSCFLRKK